MDKKRAYRVLRPWLFQLLKNQSEAEDQTLQVAHNKGLNLCALEMMRLHPGRVAMLAELPEILDNEFGDAKQ